MESEREKPWRRNVTNALIVNSILAAICAIVVQTIVASEKPRYGTGWLIVATVSLFMFVVSTEQLGESMADDNIKLYIRSSVLYNVGVLLLFLTFGRLLQKYANLKSFLSAVLFTVIVILWLYFWGRDTLFLTAPGADYDRWKRKMDGEDVGGEILDHLDIFLRRIRFRKD